MPKKSYQEQIQEMKAKDELRKKEAEKLERENKDVIRKLRQGITGNLSPREIDKLRDLLSEQQKERLQKEINKMPTDPEKKQINQRKKSKEGFEKFDREKRQRQRQGSMYIESARKGGMMKDILGDKKGKIIYKGKAKDYKMIIPIEPPSTPSEATSKMKKMKGGMVSVKTKLGRTKPTKIY